MRSEGPLRRTRGRVRPRNPATVPSRWAAFLSCDARDMCRLGPALVRNYLAFLAVSLVLIMVLRSVAKRSTRGREDPPSKA